MPVSVAGAKASSCSSAASARFSLRCAMLSPKDSDLRTPAHVHDIAEEGSDMTREIYSAALKGSQEGMIRTKSLPDVSEMLYKDVGKASDIAQPGGFRRDHVIAKLPSGNTVVPIYVQKSFLASVGPDSLLQSTYRGFANDTLHLGDEYSENVREQAYGNIGRRAVNISLVLSQIGFCCSYLIFVEKNIGEVLLHAFNLQSSITTSSWTLILLQIPLYTPLAWVRRLEYFALTSLFADVLIVFGLVYILTYTIKTLESAPPGESTWQYFNSDNWAMFLGVAVYCFEGIGLVLPTYDSMDDQIKHKFPAILSWCVMCILVICTLFAGTVYAAFGQNTQSVVTLNLPSSGESTGTMAVQLTYSLALVLSYPLMLYPVINILESNLFPNKHIKGFWRWKKNGFRFALVCLTAVIGYFGKEEVFHSFSFISNMSCHVFNI
ncbi:unnamed protein product [Phytophthora lilii]|uniref:Unnamed protein product n=1 Tax=Phytophthora lilii TaxID=2077276 RepID=A0A9W6UEL9_9STRA|nr:unnamed protein product [Phytophthora lilii]